jgi:hypothetical protein
MGTDEVLEQQTRKWLEKLEREAAGIRPAPAKADPARIRNSIANVHAYIRDAQHFLEKGDMVRAFEAVIYAWGILETLQRLGLLEE